MQHAAFVITALLAQHAAAAAEGDFKTMFAKHWRVAQEFTLAVAEAMPADSYEFKPNPEQLSFGRLMNHIAAQNSDSCATATRTTPLAEPAATDKATASEALWYTFTHMAHHRGQAEVYLRVKNITPPAWRF